MNSSEWLKLNLPELSDPADILKLTQNFKWLDGFLKEFGATHSDFEKRISKLEITADDLKNVTASTRSDLLAVQKSLSQLSVKHETDISDINASLSNANSEIGILKTAFTQLSARVDNIDEKVDESVRTINKAITEEIEKLNQRISKLEGNNPEIKIISFKSSPLVALLGESIDVKMDWELNVKAATTRINGSSVEGISYTASSVDSSRTFTLVVTDVDGNNDTAATSIKFANEIVYGTAESPDVSSVALKKLEGREMSEEISRTVSVNNGTGSYIYYAYPKRLGKVKFLTSGMFEGGFKAPQDVVYSNSAGYNEVYYVYRSANKLRGETVFTTVKEV